MCLVKQIKFRSPAYVRSELDDPTPLLLYKQQGYHQHNQSYLIVVLHLNRVPLPIADPSRNERCHCSGCLPCKKQAEGKNKSPSLQETQRFSLDTGCSHLASSGRNLGLLQDNKYPQFYGVTLVHKKQLLAHLGELCCFLSCFCKAWQQMHWVDTAVAEVIN